MLQNRGQGFHRHERVDPLRLDRRDLGQIPHCSPVAMTNANFSEVVVGPYPSYSMGPMESLLIVLLFLLWFYAIRRIYFVWSNVLNFSAIQTDSLTGRHTLGTKISGEPDDLERVCFCVSLMSC